MARGRFAAWVAVLALLGGALLLLGGLSVRLTDFYDFFLATLTLLHGGDPYTPQPTGLQGFFNPLWALFSLLPLAALSAERAFWAWQGLILLLLGGATLPLLRVYSVPPSPGLLLLLGWLFLLPWFVGQNAPLVAAGAFLMLAFGSRQRWGLAGTMAPLLAIKPHTVLLVPLILLAAGGHRAARGAILGLAAAGAAAFMVMPGWLLALGNSRWAESQAGAGQRWPDSALPSTLAFLGAPAWLYGLVVVAALACLGWRRRDFWPQLAALSLVLGLVVAPYMRAGDFPLLVPALLVLPPAWRMAAGGAALALFLLGTPIPLLWLIPAIVATTLLVWLAIAQPVAPPGALPE